MTQDHSSLVDQLYGVILLADVSWHSPSGGYADAARLFRLVGRVHGLAAAVCLVGQSVDLRISRDGLIG
ncbi:hypothetical protein N825_34255 [Skermanella stibiiresistens SB22]|uniref:Uncharacterized protein n=1 Tax=Skermanella stibiiresistens SB22 TaxID=1385369 RepID=W9GT01_9PROT|nr:hypothetical protein [Skermanella stibiiresistens]EWY35801.1 hypothetical protein N825_34255 [Skermanella stibiiresistens SB22]